MNIRHYLSGFAMMLALPAVAQSVDEVHFLIGSSPGSGWDQTARAVGGALAETGIAEATSFENIPGGAGALAVARLIETAERQGNTLLVSSTPVLIYGIQGAISYNYNDLTPVASVIGDYAALAVRADSEYETFEQVATVLEDDPRGVILGGGSVVGSMDHLVAALAFQEAGVDPLQMNYIPYEGGGAALAALLSGEIEVISSGLGEMIEQERQGQIRILGSTAPEPVGDVPTLSEQGYPVVFVNWRGFFGPPGMDNETADAMAAAINELNDTAEWEEIRDRNGWVDIYFAGEDFTAFLGEQEDQMRTLMQRLGIETAN